MSNILSRYKNAKVPKKTLQDHAEDALYREVNEEVQAQAAYDFIKKHMKLLIAGAIVIVIAVAGWQLIRAHRAAQKLESAAAYESAIAMAQNNPAAAGEALVRAAKRSSGGMADLALFDAARVDLMQGNMDSAAGKLERLAGHGSTRDFRDLATLYLAVLNANNMDAKSFEKFLSPLVSKRSPFFYTAQLFIAQKYLGAGDPDMANTWLDKIINDDNAPAVISATAQSLR